MFDRYRAARKERQEAEQIRDFQLTQFKRAQYDALRQIGVPGWTSIQEVLAQFKYATGHNFDPSNRKHVALIKTTLDEAKDQVFRQGFKPRVYAANLSS